MLSLHRILKPAMRNRLSANARSLTLHLLKSPEKFIVSGDRSPLTPAWVTQDSLKQMEVSGKNWNPYGKDLHG